MKIDEVVARVLASNLVLTVIARVNLMLVVKSSNPVGLKNLMDIQRECLLTQVRGLPMDDPMVQIMLKAVEGEFKIYEKVVEEFSEEGGNGSPLPF